MKEKYSSGQYASVYKLTPKEKLWFPQADLVREDEESDRLWFARLFYRHKIAHLLFPNNFICVVGTSVEPYAQELYDEVKIGDEVFRTATKRIHRLFSKTAAVNPDHAIYSDHMRIIIDENDGWIRKKSICPCQRCSDHREKHKAQHMEENAKKLSLSLRNIGIGVTYTDPSDYCLVDKNIIFFEIDNFDEDRLTQYLEKLQNPTPTQQETIILLNRHKVLHSMSAQAMRIGKANSVRLN